MIHLHEGMLATYLVSSALAGVGLAYITGAFRDAVRIKGAQAENERLLKQNLTFDEHNQELTAENKWLTGERDEVRAQSDAIEKVNRETSESLENEVMGHAITKHNLDFFKNQTRRTETALEREEDISRSLRHAAQTSFSWYLDAAKGRFEAQNRADQLSEALALAEVKIEELTPKRDKRGRFAKPCTDIVLASDWKRWTEPTESDVVEGEVVFDPGASTHYVVDEAHRFSFDEVEISGDYGVTTLHNVIVRMVPLRVDQPHKSYPDEAIGFGD